MQVTATSQVTVTFVRGYSIVKVRHSFEEQKLNESPLEWGTRMLKKAGGKSPPRAGVAAGALRGRVLPKR